MSVGQPLTSLNSGREELGFYGSKTAPFEEQHFSVIYWSKLWGFSAKTIREWFADEYGPGVLRQANTGSRRLKRNYITLMVSPTAAARVYDRRTMNRLT